MSVRLDPTERRIIGSLIEKQLTTPDQYPLTLNALLAACNQKNNRDPVSEYREHEIQGAIRALMDRGWVTQLERAGSRTTRYEHRAAEQFGVDEGELAILAELMLRGPESTTELNTRASRMRELRSPEAVEAKLLALAERPVPYVEFLGRRPGERVPRWRHLLASEPAGAEAPATAADAPIARPAAVSHGSPTNAARADEAGDVARFEELEMRIDRLERAVAELRAALDGR